MKKLVFFLGILTSLLVISNLNPVDAYAVCPICTVAVVGGLGLSRWLGIDDAVTSIWIGGFILSSGFWFTDWLTKKTKKEISLYNQVIIIALIYLLVLIPLKLQNIIGHPLNTILGIDKIVFGTFLGSVIFLLAVLADKKIRKVKGKQLFQYQKVVFPIASLVIASLLMYFYGGILGKI